MRSKRGVGYSSKNKLGAYLELLERANDIFKGTEWLLWRLLEECCKIKRLEHHGHLKDIRMSKAGLAKIVSHRTITSC